MGFLKFLKREKKGENLDELDLPPAPPPLEGAQAEFGTAGFEENLPELPEFPDFGEGKISVPEEMPKFEFPEEEMHALGKEGAEPEFPSFPEIEETPPFTAPVTEHMPSTPQMPEPEQVTEEETNLMPSDIYSKTGRLFTHEKRVFRERPSGKIIYIKVDNFKATLGSINIVRSDLRKSEEALMKLENMKNAKDKSFDKVKSLLEDLQKKLIFVDKTLFKGE